MEQKSRRNLLSIVFMLAMVIGLVTGMGMMAHADDAGGTYIYIDVGTGHAGFFNNLLSSHPPLEKRIERLEHGKAKF